MKLKINNKNTLKSFLRKSKSSLSRLVRHVQDIYRKNKMTKSFLSLLLTIFVALVRAMRIAKRDDSLKRSALVIPPSPPGSLGDEAMLTATIQTLRKDGFSNIGLISYDPSKGRYSKHVNETIDLHRYFNNDSWKDRFRFALAVTRYQRFYCLGADVLDGYYSDHESCQRIHLVSLAAKTGAHTTILGFSMNNHPTPASIQALTELPRGVRLCSRDPVSMKRLVHYVKRPIELVSDVAFLLRPVKDSQVVTRVLHWVHGQKAMGHLVIGVNANTLCLRDMHGHSHEETVRVHADTLRKLFSQDNRFSFLLIPHDFRGKYSDITLAVALLKALPVEMKPYCTCVPTPCTATDIKSICGTLDFVLCGRMHLAIACLGQGTPVACISYQGKFEGLFQHFDLEGMTLDPKCAFESDILFSFVMPLIKQRNKIREQIQLRLPRIQELSKLNLPVQ